MQDERRGWIMVDDHAPHTPDTQQKIQVRIAQNEIPCNPSCDTIRVKWITVVSNTRLKNLKLAISRRIQSLGYADKLNVIVRSRKVLIIRI